MKPEFIERMLEAMREATGATDVADPPGLPKPSSDPTTPEEFRTNFQLWMSDDGLPWRPDRPLGAPCVLHHAKTFWTFRYMPNIHLLHYNDLLQDLEGEMRRLSVILGIEIDESLWPVLVEAATFEKMKGNAEMLVPEADKDMWNSRQGFFHKGTANQWQGVLGDEELSLYRSAMKQRLEPELADWLENGRL